MENKETEKKKKKKRDKEIELEKMKPSLEHLLGMKLKFSLPSAVFVC